MLRCYLELKKSSKFIEYTNLATIDEAQWAEVSDFDYTTVPVPICIITCVRKVLLYFHVLHFDRIL